MVVGVPVITPVAASSVNPAGSAGLIANVTVAPPVTVGRFAVVVVMATPLLYATGASLYLSRLGASSFTVTLNEYVDDPPVFVAVTA
jgi:hypothetical protein